MKRKTLGRMEILRRVKFYVKWTRLLLKTFDSVASLKSSRPIKCGYIDCISPSLNIISENIKVSTRKSPALSIFLTSRLK